MKATYATMHKTICLDKATDSEGLPAPVTFHVKKVINGQQPWMQGNGNRSIAYGCKTLEEAMVNVYESFMKHLNACNRDDSFYKENWKTWGRSHLYKWMKAGNKSFRYDNYTVCIVTSNGDLVH